MKTLTKEEFMELIDMVDKARKINPSWRLGQTLFNCLYILYPELANEIRSTALDPFYRSERVGDLLKVICSPEAYELVTQFET